mgnify:CR=1 FL=1
MSDFSRVKRYLFFGTVGNILGWIIYNVIFFSNPFSWNKATTTWLLSYLIGVAQQHEMHRRWTFSETKQDYLDSLKNSYLAYSLGLIVSTIANYHFVYNMEIGLQVSWLLSVIASIVVNYFALKRFAFKLT